MSSTLSANKNHTIEPRVESAYGSWSNPAASSRMMTKYGTPVRMAASHLHPANVLQLSRASRHPPVSVSCASAPKTNDMRTMT